MAKVQFVNEQGDEVIRPTDYPHPITPGSRIDFFGKMFEITEAPQHTERRDGVLGQEWVRVVTVKPIGPAPVPNSKSKKNDKGAGGSRAGKSVVAE